MFKFLSFKKLPAPIKEAVTSVQVDVEAVSKRLQEKFEGLDEEFYRKFADEVFENVVQSIKWKLQQKFEELVTADEAKLNLDKDAAIKAAMEKFTQNEIYFSYETREALAKFIEKEIMAKKEKVMEHLDHKKLSEVIFAMGYQRIAENLFRSYR